MTNSRLTEAVNRRRAGLAGAMPRGLAAAAVAAMVMASPAASMAEDALVLPSGRSVVFHDVIWGERGPAGLTVRFRFLEKGLPAMVDAVPYADLEADMKVLCETFAIQRIANTGPQPSQIIVSISDRPVEFGAADPDATQIFEAYRPEDGACIWEGF